MTQPESKHNVEPTTFSHAEFLRSAAEHLEVEADSLSRRPDPVGIGNETDLTLLARRQGVAEKKAGTTVEEIHLKALTEALLSRPYARDWDDGAGSFTEALEVINQAVSGAVRQVGGTTITEVEEFCRNGLEEFAGSVEQATKPEVLGAVLTRLAAEAIKDQNDEVILELPPAISGERLIEIIGVNLDRGTLVIIGDVGDSVGYKAKGTAHIILQGNARESAGAEMSGEAILEIKGDAGDFAAIRVGDQAKVLIVGNVSNYLAFEAGGRCQIEVNGNAGDNVGQQAKESAEIIVKGNAGNYLGAEAVGDVEITVHGNAGFYAGRGAEGVRILINGDAEWEVGEGMSYPSIIEVKGSAGSISQNRGGTIIVGGEVVYDEGHPED